MKKVIDTRAVFKIGGIGLAFKKVNSKLNHINISCILPPAHEREVLIFISQYTYTHVERRKIMNFQINKESKQPIETLVIGLPDHINQLNDVKYYDESMTDQLETLKQHHIIGSSVGKVSSTMFYINNQPKRLLTVGLGNLKICHINNY